MAAATSALPGWPPLLPSVRSAAGPLIRRQHRWSSHLRAGPRPPFLRSQRRRSSARPLLPPARRAEAEELKARKNGGADDNGGVDQLARRQDHQSELTDAELHPAEKESPWRGRWSPTAGAATEEPARQPASHQLGLGHQLRSGKNPCLNLGLAGLELTTENRNTMPTTITSIRPLGKNVLEKNRSSVSLTQSHISCFKGCSHEGYEFAATYFDSSGCYWSLWLEGKIQCLSEPLGLMEYLLS